MDTTIERSDLEGKLLPELQQIAQTLGVEGTQKLRKAGLIDYLFHTKELVARPIDPPRVSDGTVLPSPEQPSDHLALVAEIVWAAVAAGR